MSERVSQSSCGELGLAGAAQNKACHGEFDYSILGQEAPDQWCVFLAHVLVVVFFAHAGLTIGANRPLKQTTGFLA